MFLDKRRDYFKENVHMFDVMDFLAELTQHIPPKGTLNRPSFPGDQNL